MKALSIPGQRAAQVRITPGALQLCESAHRRGPVYPCPVCFLFLAYSQGLTDFAHGLVAAIAERSEELGEVAESAKKAAREFEELRGKVLSHVEPAGGVQ